MKRRIIKISVIVLLSIISIFIVRSCVLSIARFGTQIPRDNTPFLENIDSFSYMVDRAKEFLDTQNTDGSVECVGLSFYSYNETIIVRVYRKTNDESENVEMKMTAADIEHINNINKVFEKWNGELFSVVAYKGQVNFLAYGGKYALIYRDNAWYPSSFAPGKDKEGFYAERITFKWFHSYIKS
ncbi:MAG: hypothetical protein IJ404_01665 [Clostridia bacterium]|nr:hypothetical protein [Clostridia bacterium]